MTLRDVVVPQRPAVNFTTIRDVNNSPTTVTLEDVALDELSLLLDRSDHTAELLRTNINRIDANCGSTATSVTLREHGTGLVGPPTGSLDNINLSACTATLEQVTLVNVGSEGVSAASGSAVTATDLTITGGRRAVRVIDGSFDGTRVDARQTDAACVDAVRATFTLRDSVVADCNQGGSAFAALELSQGSDGQLIDTVVENTTGQPARGGGLHLSGSSLTCTKDLALSAGVLGSSPHGAYLNDALVTGESSLVSNGCDWANPVDVYLDVEVGPGEEYVFGSDASFTCVLAADGTGSCL